MVLLLLYFCVALRQGCSVNYLFSSRLLALGRPVVHERELDNLKEDACKVIFNFCMLRQQIDQMMKRREVHVSG